MPGERTFLLAKDLEIMLPGLLLFLPLVHGWEIQPGMNVDPAAGVADRSADFIIHGDEDDEDPTTSLRSTDIFYYC